MCVYGASGNGKTSQCLYIAKHIWETTGKKTRLISADGGGWEPLQGMINAGIIEPMNISNEQFALAKVRKLSIGWWDRKFRIKETGEIKTVFSQCLPAELAKIGCYYIEGLTSIGSLWLGHISKSTDKVLFESAAYVEDGETFRGTDKGHFNLVQTQLYDIVQAFGTLPIDLVVWTALVGKAEERFTKETQYGPKLPGGAKTLEAPQWVGDCFHLEEVQFAVAGSDQPERGIRAHFQSHRDVDTGVKYLCKSRLSPVLIKRLLGTFPGGFIDLELPTDGNKWGAGLDKYLIAIEKLQEQDSSMLKDWATEHNPMLKQEKAMVEQAKGVAQRSEV